MASLLLLAAAALFALSWGRLLPYLDERSRTPVQMAFRLMHYTRLTFAQAKSLLLTLAYLAFGVAGAFLFAAAAGVSLPVVLSFQTGFLQVTLLGIIAEISLANLLVGLYTRLLGRRDTDLHREVNSIPWIMGVRRLPGPLARLAPAGSAVCEEFFFRGVLLIALAARLGALPALLIVTALFAVQQALQVNTRGQLAVILAGSAAISAFGGILVLATGSAVPACLCHASFVLFYLRRPSDGSNHAMPA